MGEINKRFVLLRKELGLSQRGLGDSIGLSNSGVSNIENGLRNVTDQHIKLLQSEFNANEDWLRTGEGEMFVQQTDFSLDEYAEKNKLSPLEIDIMKSYMEVDANIREGILSHFKDVFARHAETAATIEPTPEQIAAEEAEAYRLEVLAELKTEKSSASHVQKGKSS